MWVRHLASVWHKAKRPKLKSDKYFNRDNKMTSDTSDTSTMKQDAIGRGQEYLVFVLDDQEYGIDILTVQEIRGYHEQTVTRIANVPPFIKGVTNLRRSEEHTSELQSRGHLVCRLLLEKKNRDKKNRRRQK